MEKIQQTFSSSKFKKLVYIILVAMLIGWVVFRFAAIGSENARYVFNASRVAADTGAPIEYIEMRQSSHVLYEPISVKNNRAYVSGALAKKLRPGQVIGDGIISSVSSKIDLDTGMYVVRTRGVSDGLQYAQFHVYGMVIPLHAISNGTVLVADNGIATVRDVMIASQDSENAYITSGLNAGDIVILSRVNADTKVNIQK